MKFWRNDDIWGGGGGGGELEYYYYIIDWYRYNSLGVDVAIKKKVDCHKRINYSQQIWAKIPIFSPRLLKINRILMAISFISRQRTFKRTRFSWRGV